MTSQTRTYWTCIGSVRGACGVKHRSEDAARACCARDHAGCRSQGATAYSDREPVERTITRVEPVRQVRVQVRTVGQAFGCVGVLVARNGRDLWSGPTRPHGFTAAAREDAEAEAGRRGWTVRP